MLDRLTDEYAAAGKETLFESLKRFLWGSDGSTTYAQIARQLSMTEGAVKSAVRRLRMRYAATAAARNRPDGHNCRRIGGRTQLAAGDVCLKCADAAAETFGRFYLIRRLGGVRWRAEVGDEPVTDLRPLRKRTERDVARRTLFSLLGSRRFRHRRRCFCHGSANHSSVGTALFRMASAFERPHVRRLRTIGGDRSRRHGRRLQGAAKESRSDCGRQDYPGPRTSRPHRDGAI